MRKNLQPSVDQAKQTFVQILDEHDAEQGEFSAFECFGFESDLNGRVCILSSGQWYEVLADFVARVNRRIGELPRTVATLPPWNRTDSEDAYSLLCARNRGFLLCDRRIFRFGGHGPKYQFEFCDSERRTCSLLFTRETAYRSQIRQAC